ncbi:MAG: hypothetical protein IPN72_13350 [Saprospiraceae bacterium]|nr:hypothetical protein [Saprospiraceae bacterium]
MSIKFQSYHAMKIKVIANFLKQVNLNNLIKRLIYNILGSHINFIFYFITLYLIVLTGCQTKDFANQIMAISEAEHNIKCELEVMKKEINKEWDTMNESLDDHLPADMAEQEKVNMLKVRNANLIRMFNTFKTLDSEIKDQLRSVEKKDSMMAIEINLLKEKLIEVEHNKMELFNEILKENGQTAILELKEMYQKNLLKTCSSK